MAYTIKQARPVLLNYLGLTEENANYIENTDKWGIKYEKNDLKCVIFMMPLGENTSSPKIYFDVRDSGAEKFVAAWEYAESNDLKFFCLGVKDENETYKNSVISVEADIKTVLKVSGLENGRRSGSGTQLNIPKRLIPNGNVTRTKSDKFDIFFAAINKSFLLTYLEIFDNRLFQYIYNSNNLVSTAVNIDCIPIPHNRIIFGAPGTGKSHKLKEDSEQFENQEPIESDEKDIIKQEIIEANELNDKLNRYIAIGFSHSEFLKDYTTKQIRETFEIENCEDNIYVGAKAKFYYDKYIEDNDDDETITKRINEAKAIKGDGMLQVLAGIGFRFSETLMDYTKEELKKEYPLDSRPQIYWVYRAVHGAKYIKTKKQEKIKYLERVTFHPNYSYAQFVGTYKPVQDSADENQIKYEYIPGPFMRIYTAAKQNPSQNFLLLIEEINRANVAAVFGDVFQLLDRKSDGTSEYPIATSKDLRKFLAKPENLGGNPDDYKTLSIPSNMYIWATMNSADQGVFPMDTAFKRRWEFEYIDINKNADKLVDEDNKPILIPIPSKEGKLTAKEIKYDLYKWNDVREKINDKLSEISSVSEDKLLGPFFINLEKLRSAKNEPQEFIGLFKSKVLMYLFEDVVKISPTKLFEKCGDHPRYSTICSKFDEIGCGIFGFELEKQDPSETEPSETPNE